jgi:amino-acid N-acetyltransferase
VAEVRSLVVGGRHRGKGLGRRLVAELRRRARQQGFDELCAFVHDADYFGRLGFSTVPHARIPEKIEADCRQCPQFGQCGQRAMVAELAPANDTRAAALALRSVVGLRSEA